MNDPVKNPSHYQFENACLEVRDVIRDRINLLSKTAYCNDVGTLAYDYSNAIKYLLRAFFKGGPIEDLNKAKYCIDTLLNLLTSPETTTNQPVECESDILTAVYDEILGIDVPNPELFEDWDYKDNTPRAKFKGQGW